MKIPRESINWNKSQPNDPSNRWQKVRIISKNWEEMVIKTAMKMNTQVSMRTSQECRERTTRTWWEVSEHTTKTKDSQTHCEAQLDSCKRTRDNKLTRLRSSNSSQQRRSASWRDWSTRSSKQAGRDSLSSLQALDLRAWTELLPSAWAQGETDSCKNILLPQTMRKWMSLSLHLGPTLLRLLASLPTSEDSRVNCRAGTRVQKTKSSSRNEVFI